MRFLCLHGKGTSAAIFSVQTASFRYKLDDDSINFEFIDGLFPSDPAPDVPYFYSPPYYAWWEGNNPASVRTSHTWLLSKLARDGPYDGVLLFSQGCSLIASFLLYHQATNPTSPPPFKVAIFICGGIPLQILEDLGAKVSQEAHDWDEKTRVLLREKNTDAASILSQGHDRWGSSAEDDTAEEAESNDPSATMNNPHNVFGLDTTQFSEHSKIRIPTVHIYGAKDPRRSASLQLACLCRAEVRKIYDHGGGHDIPRRKEVSEAIAGLVRWSVKMAEGDEGI